jgi:hypothetical protein
VDVRGDREVLMLYTSFNQSLDSALIWVYGPDAQAIAVGSTTGPTSDPHFARLNWEEILTRFDGRQPLLARDWRVQYARLCSSRIPSSPEECRLERICHHLCGTSPKGHAVPGTRPESLVDRFESSLFPCRDSNCLHLDNFAVEETPPSPESTPKRSRSVTVIFAICRFRANCRPPASCISTSRASLRAMNCLQGDNLATWNHSCRSATNGSTRVARRAGT